MDAVKTPEAQMADWRPKEKAGLEEVRARYLASQGSERISAKSELTTPAPTSIRARLPELVFDLKSTVGSFGKKILYAWESATRHI